MWKGDGNLVMNSDLVSLKMTRVEQRQRTFASMVDISRPAVPRDLSSSIDGRQMPVDGVRWSDALPMGGCWARLS
jgi:hypothetical protein